MRLKGHLDIRMSGKRREKIKKFFIGVVMSLFLIGAMAVVSMAGMDDAHAVEQNIVNPRYM